MTHLGHELEEGAEVGVVDDLGLELGAVEGGQRTERTVGRNVLREGTAEGRGGAEAVQRRCSAGATGQAADGVQRRKAAQRCRAGRACGETIS